LARSASTRRASCVESQVLQRFEADAPFTHVELLAQPAEARVSILLYDALDFSTDRDDGGGQTRESLSRVASASAAVTGLDPARTETVSRFVIILSLAVFGRVKAEGFAPDVPIKFARVGSV